MPDNRLKLAELISQLKLPSPVTELHSPLLSQRDIRLSIKRDELIHPLIQGNKWRKLKYNLQQAENRQQHRLLSFGGPWSNHLHALAAAGKMAGFETIGLIRGQQAAELNPCLQDMQDWGMQLEFLSRIDYKNRNSNTFIQKLRQKFGDFYLIPEGGNNTPGIKGCAELLHELPQAYDYICCEVGTGTMLNALIMNIKNPATRILGFSVMKNPQLTQQITDKLAAPALNSRWQIIHRYHFSGFAKTSDQLNGFIEDFQQQYEIQLEPVYSGKMLYGLFDMIKQDFFPPGSHILAIHGGGLQGLRGFPQIRTGKTT